MATTITFGECAENHAGMQKLGSIAAEGFTEGELREAKAAFERQGVECELIDLVALGAPGPGAEGAWVLIARGGVAALGASEEALLAEQKGLTVDTMARMRGRVVNKRARHNLCFDAKAQEPDYEAGKGRVVAFADVPRLSAVRAALPAFFSEKAAALRAEGNYYYDLKKCGIGFHGDSERRIVVAVRLGPAFPLHFQWYKAGARVGLRVALELGRGDVYAMSAKAVGTDWKTRKTLTLRHAAGCPKFLA